MMGWIRIGTTCVNIDDIAAFGLVKPKVAGNKCHRLWINLKGATGEEDMYIFDEPRAKAAYDYLDETVAIDGGGIREF